MPRRTARKPKSGSAAKKRAAAAPAAVPATPPTTPPVRAPKPAVAAPPPAPAMSMPPRAPAKPSVTPSASRAQGLPKVQEKTYYQSAVVFGLGVVAVAVMLFAIVRDINLSRTPAPPSPQQEEDPLFADVRKNEDFKSWLTTWRSLDPYVSAAEFTIEQSGAIRTTSTPDLAVTPEREQLLPPLANRYVWSPEKSRFIDYLASFGEPDSSLQVFNRDGNGKIETLAYCGTPCRYDRVFWLDEDRAVVLGIEEATKDDGSSLCLPASGSTGEMKCYQRLNATVYDFAHGAQTKYRSESHIFASQPFGAEKNERWASGLSPEERTTLGLDAGSGVEFVTGVIGEIAADVRILTVNGGKVPRIVALADDAVIRDEQGKVVPFSALHAGFTVEARAVERPDGTVLAGSLRIVRAPNIIVDAPEDGADVGAKFSVKGVARVFEGNVRVRLTNARTLKTVVDGFTTAAAADAGLFGPFTYGVIVPSGAAKKGDNFSLEVFADSAADGSEIDKVTFLLHYQP
ncbi:MAG TPA: Gmad2 immunoglobulin-like domain-containing protein [Patescibacteria group bacterium]|nr:Gmad2 immunoglobulin-like domain-containing protein [Patescibacteria group bacterium]